LEYSSLQCLHQTLNPATTSLQKSESERRNEEDEIWYAPACLRSTPKAHSRYGVQYVVYPRFLLVVSTCSLQVIFIRLKLCNSSTGSVIVSEEEKELLVCTGIRTKKYKVCVVKKSSNAISPSSTVDCSAAIQPTCNDVKFRNRY
jgi:hypothetical protein